MKLSQLILLSVILLQTSCSKDYDSTLRGKWQLRERVTPQESVVRDSLFYNFDNYVFCFQKLNTTSYGRVELFGEFAQIGDSLIIDIKDDRFSSPYYLTVMEWYSPIMRFQIEELSNKKLVLSDADTTYTFRKF
ncbi:MAG: lipocalin-like domain-containing protein [Bacteroidales bacterium]